MGDFFKEDWFAERKKEAEESKKLDAKKRAKVTALPQKGE